jgi:limonene-1,2-epoxide hydrolase
MPTNIATEPQMYSSKQQQENAQLIRDYFEARHDENTRDYGRFFDEKVRIFIDSRADYPIGEKVGIGLDTLKQNASELSKTGFTYDIEIHSIYTCGPVVIVARTDIRKEAGKPDKPVPAVGVFAIKNGKIVEWSDYYR